MVVGRVRDDSSLSRLLSKMEQHDTETITAFRGVLQPNRFVPTVHEP